MIRGRVLALLAALAVSPACAVGVGEPAPALSARDFSGQDLGLAQLRGRVVYVDFWASWCPPCLQSLPRYESLWRELEPQGFTVVGVNLDREKTLALRALARTGASFPVLADPGGRWAAAFALPAMPSGYVIDRRGVVRHVQSGYRAGDESTLRKAIEAVLKEPA